MDPPNRNRNNGSSNAVTRRTLQSSNSDKSLGDSFINGATNHSSCSSDSLHESSSSINGAIRMFNSPLATFKNKIVQSKKMPLMRKGGMLGQRNPCERELKMDNAEYLSGLMSLHAGKQAMCEIDKSFESDFDESARWQKRM